MKVTIELKLMLLTFILLVTYLMWGEPVATYINGPHPHLDNFKEVNWGEVFLGVFGR